MKPPITFTKKISSVGSGKRHPLIYIPITVAKLITIKKEYKVTLEEIEVPEDPLTTWTFKPE